MTDGRSVRCVHAVTTRASRQTPEQEEEGDVRRVPSTAAPRPASNAARTAPAATACSLAAASASSSCRRRAPPWRRSTARRTFHRAAGVSSAGDLDHRLRAPARRPSSRRRPAFRRYRRRSWRVSGRARPVISRPPRGRSLCDMCQISRGRFINLLAILRPLLHLTLVVASGREG